jgi:murein DD-endopeptidase MepM/ murein hydrolase activator NlpD
MLLPRREPPAVTLRQTLGRLSSLCVCAALAVVVPAITAGPAEITVTHRARSIQPGEVMVLTVESARPLREVRVTAFGRQFPCFDVVEPVAWRALVGIDLTTKPGPYVVKVVGRDADGRTVTSEHAVTIAPKHFPTRRLTVDQRFVSPPAEVLARIEADAKRVQAIRETVSPARYWSGSFVLPVPGAVVSEFGKLTVYNGQSTSPHLGTDFAGAAGTPIRAPNAGRVVLAADLYYTGHTIILDHGQGLYSYFGHMSAFSVREGDTLATGDVVGLVGATGRVTGPHLHWSVWLAGIRVDPLSLVDVLAPQQ